MESKTSTNNSGLKQARPYRVWHIANVPNRPFHVYVETIKKAKQVLQFLFDYDNYLGDGVVDTNASGLEVFEEGDWFEYHDENDDDIMEIMRKEHDAKPLVLTPENRNEAGHG